MAVPPPSPDLTDKQALRATLRRGRAAFVAGLGDARPAAEAALAGRLLERIPPGATVALYQALPDEPDPAPLAGLLAAEGHRLALPHVAADKVTMRFLAWQPGDPLAKGGFGILQPIGTDAVAPAVIVTPLVGFDRAGGRIGQGAGHYDRAFAALPGAIRVGYAWSVQEQASVPHDPWDVPLHAVATEAEWIGVEAIS
ncbi:5-formyltetrahydrofolate cyclo-ligase [uncultured Sphingomonas sp.]|uniref:5-formyltetrahydrofolate cyclo-ligase n=1 Tax=uncultured Sphingomonas sp. TaxID=158754 RepID=UPI0025CD0214|nr:5-formyltetrahydrofolate cyclo-ligase [uncultured Sphingomonas sp.]